MADGRPPTLVVCAHGTRDVQGRATVRGVIEAVAAGVPGVQVLEAYVDVHGPEVGDVVAAVPRAPGEGIAAVVVPLLLAAGYHMHVDIAAAISGRADVLVTGALGPDDRLVDLLVDRLVRVGAERGGVVVLAPAGSSDPRATADSAETAARLARRWGGPVTVGYAAGPVPTVADAVAAARAGTDGAPVAVASYLLAPGSFQRRVETAGGDVVTGPLAPDPRVVEIVVARYRDALRAPP